jgi:hypothetical protein
MVGLLTSFWFFFYQVCQLLFQGFKLSRLPLYGLQQFFMALRQAIYR